MGNNCSVLQGRPKQLSIKLRAFLQTKLGSRIFNHREREDEMLNTDCDIYGNCIFVKTANGVEIISSASDYNSINKSEISYLVDLRFGSNGVMVGDQAFQYPDDPLNCPIWQVVTQKTPVQVGDIFKLSTHILKVVDIKMDDFPHHPMQPTANFIPANSGIKSRMSSRNDEKVCKTEASNPIIVPCKCQGTIKYIHIQCLRDWITHSRAYSSTTTGMRIKKDALVCTVCKTNYESSLFEKNKQLRSIMLEDKVRAPYIKFQVISENPNDDQFIIVESFNDQDRIVIGRKSSCQIKMGLQHLSRYHSLLTIDRENRQIFIEDMGSSFGTLRYIHGPNLMTVKGQVMRMQMGNMVIDLSLDITSISKTQPPVYNPFLEAPAIIAEGQKYIHTTNSLRLLPSHAEYARLSQIENNAH